MDVFVDLDERSVGVFPFPLNLCKSEGNGRGRSTLYRPGQVDEQGVLTVQRDVIFPKVHHPTPLPDWAEGSVCQWLRLPRFFAPVVLAEAIPHFWWNRHRRERADEVIGRPGLQSVQLALRTGRRGAIRESLFHHGDSLKNRLWAIRYHRKNLRQAMESLHEGSGNPAELLIHLNAEFAAHDGCAYSVLEELAVIHALMVKIVEGKDITQSFHELVKKPEKRGVLGDSIDRMGWFQAFRDRRANATHYFATGVGFFNKDSGEISAFQHGHSRVFHRSNPNPLAAATPLSEVFETLVEDFDHSVEDIAVDLLGMFHESDLVSILNKSPSDLAAPSKPQLVWTRNVEFDDSLAAADQCWAIMGEDGRIVVSSGTTGDLCSTAVPRGGAEDATPEGGEL